MDVAEARREVLRGFLATNGGFAEVGKRFKLTQPQASYLSQLTAKDSTASFGERSAKNWEDRLKMPAGTLVSPLVPPKRMAGGGDPINQVREPSTHRFAPEIRVVIERLGEVLIECKSHADRKVAGQLLQEFAMAPDSGLAKSALIARLIELTGRVPIAFGEAQVAEGQQEALERLSREAEEHANKRRSTAQG